MTSQDAIRKKNAVMKSHHSIVLISSATRIRTWKMLESESSALPFGDSATTCVIIADHNRFVNSNFKVFLLISQSDLI